MPNRDHLAKLTEPEVINPKESINLQNYYEIHEHIYSIYFYYF